MNYKGNKAADEAAIDGAHAGYGIRQIVTVQPWYHIKGEVDAFIKQKWKQPWTNDNRSKHTKLFMNGPNITLGQGYTKTKYGCIS